MSRNTHDRAEDHHGVDLDTNVVLDGATSSYLDQATVHSVLDDLDTRISDGLDLRQLTAAPSSAPEGYSYYDLTDHMARTWDGSAWKDHW